MRGMPLEHRARRAWTTIATMAVVLVTIAVAPVHLAGRSSASAGLIERFADMAGGPSRAALTAALNAYEAAADRGVVAHEGLLTVIDYTRPSTEPRLWVLDLQVGRIVYRELVAHGRETGDNIARAFSNAPGSLKSSLGLFVTDTTYVGKNGYSLRLRGLDPGVNDNAYARAIVLHGASYVSQAIAARLGRLGRSWGCTAVRLEIARSLIDTIKGGTALYAYGGVRAAHVGD